MELLILVDQFVLKFSDLHFDHFVSFGDLEVGDLGAERLDFLSDLLDQLSSLGSFELHWACYYHSTALSSFTCGSNWGQLAIRLHNHLLTISSSYYLLTVHLLSFVEAA